MAGLTKIQLVDKKKEEEVVVPKKYRYEFDSYKEYNKYKGEKG